MSTIPLNLTPTFETALRRLSAAGQDRGVRINPTGGNGMRAHRVATGFSDRAVQIERLPEASDRHSIACGSELVPGDEILFIESRMRRVRAHRRARRATDLIQETEVVTGQVDFIGFTDAHNHRIARLSWDSNTHERLLDRLTQFGCWRAPWADEAARDRYLAALLDRWDREAEHFSRYVT